MNRKILIPALALAIALLSGCAASSGDGAEASRLFGQKVLFTRTASDEEAFAGRMEEAGEKIWSMDEAVPLAALEEEREEGWLLVRYTVVDGEAKPLWFRVWTGERWSGASRVCEGERWRLPAGAREMPEAQMVRPFD